jgi:hypothetical protein
MLNLLKLQYQCHAPKDQEDFAAFAFEAGVLADKLVYNFCLCYLKFICS